MAQGCSSVIGAEKLPVISSKFRQASLFSVHGDQEVSQNRFMGCEAIFGRGHFTSFQRNLALNSDSVHGRKICVQLSLCQKAENRTASAKVHARARQSATQVAGQGNLLN